MVARNTWDEYLAELIRQCADTPNQYAMQIYYRRHDFHVIGGHQLLMDIAAHHIAAEDEHDAGISRINHMIGQKVDCILYQTSGALVCNSDIEFVLPADLCRINVLPPVPVTCK